MWGGSLLLIRLRMWRAGAFISSRFVFRKQRGIRIWVTSTFSAETVLEEVSCTILLVASNFPRHHSNSNVISIYKHSVGSAIPRVALLRLRTWCECSVGIPRASAQRGSWSGATPYTPQKTINVQLLQDGRGRETLASVRQGKEQTDRWPCIVRTPNGSSTTNKKPLSNIQGALRI
jgi:hypothetical protein